MNIAQSLKCCLSCERRVSKKSSIADVARLAGVSRTTVSYVFNNVTTIHISEKTRRRVMEAARELNYHPSAIARSLAHQQALTLGQGIMHLLLIVCF